MKIYHNPRCTKSREALNLLEDKKLKVEIIKYLDEGLTEKELISLLKKLKIPAIDIIRKNESAYKSEIKGKDLSESQLIKLIIKYPKLLQRPIILDGRKAIMARPIENLIHHLNA